jgi:hypothetical protein
VNALAAPVPTALPHPHRVTMPLWPKSFIIIGTGLLTAHTARRLRRKKTALGQQDCALAALTTQFGQTSFWSEHGIGEKLTYDKFQAATPPRTYEDFSPAIERMKAGEADVLWPGACAFYAVSSGTTAGRTKYLPITKGMLAHFRQAGLDSLLYYTARVGHAGVFRGRHLFLGGSTQLAPLMEVRPFQAYTGDLSGITALNLPPWVEKHLYEPGAEIAQMADWPAKLAAITARTAGLDISLLAGIPSWILILAEAMRKNSIRGKARALNLQGIWPNLECFIHGGVPIAPFDDELRAALGPTVNFHEVYPASEAFIATQDSEALAGLRLMTNCGVFYEFLPMADFNQANLPALARKAVPLAGVKTGVDYALLLTTPAGLARYVIGDIVRFTSTEPPRLVYVGRTQLQLSAFGEHVIEKELTDALTTVCRRHQWSIVNFHVAPLFVNSATGQTRGRHEWWIELKPGTTTTPIGPQLSAKLDTELQRLNDDYEAKRLGGGLDSPIVRLVMPGVFEHWLRFRGKWGGQHKMPRCRSDRLIADELAKVTHFAKD